MSLGDGGFGAAFRDEFSVADSVGGWRGVIESAAPGVVFIVAYVTAGGFVVPVIAAIAVMVVLIAVRLFERQSTKHALSGAFGVALGAVWALLAGEPSGFYAPALLLYAAYAVALIASIVVKWPIVGVVWALVTGQDSSWRSDRAVMRTMQGATGVAAGLFLVRLAAQVPLYLVDAVAALGVVKLATGLPLFALAAWIVWSMIRGVAPDQADRDQPQNQQ